LKRHKSQRRAIGQSDAYESLKEQTRGKTLTQADYTSWVETLKVDESTRAKLAALTPSSYIGVAVKLTDRITG